MLFEWKLLNVFSFKPIVLFTYKHMYYHYIIPSAILLTLCDRLWSPSFCATVCSKTFFHHLCKWGICPHPSCGLLHWELSLLIPLLLWPLWQVKGTLPSAPHSFRNRGHRNEGVWDVSLPVAQSRGSFSRLYTNFF